MILHSNWKGFMKLSLVSVPVKAYAANHSSEKVCLNQLHAKCNNRIKYKKVCPIHGEVRNDEIVKFDLQELSEIAALREEITWKIWEYYELLKTSNKRLFYTNC